jgi:hypothetical protein
MSDRPMTFSKDKREALASNPVIPLACCLLFSVIALTNLMMVDAGHYRILAESFLAGRLDFHSEPVSGWGDTSRYLGRYYWPIGALPAVLAIPFIYLGIYTQGRFSLAASLIIAYLCVKLARKFNYSFEDSLWFALAFCFATSFVGVAILPVGSYLAQVVAVLFLFLALCELEGSRRPLVIGAMTGFAMAARPVSGLNIIFFIGMALVRNDPSAWRKFIEVIKIAIPFGIIAAVLALYNYARFGDLLEFGYRYQLMFSGEPFAAPHVPTMSLRYMPGNLWDFLFALPDGRGIATSALLMSPYLVWLLPRAKWDLTGKILALNILIVLAVLLAFRNVGYFQVGYRFSLDFLPLVFWGLMRSGITLSPPMKWFIFASALFDTFLAIHFVASSASRVPLPPLG